MKVTTYGKIWLDSVEGKIILSVSYVVHGYRTESTFKCVVIDVMCDS